MVSKWLDHRQTITKQNPQAIARAKELVRHLEVVVLSLTQTHSLVDRGVPEHSTQVSRFLAVRQAHGCTTFIHELEDCERRKHAAAHDVPYEPKREFSHTNTFARAYSFDAFQPRHSKLRVERCVYCSTARCALSLYTAVV